MLVISCGFDLAVVGVKEPWIHIEPVFMVDPGNDDHHGFAFEPEDPTPPKVEKKVPFKLTIVK